MQLEITGPIHNMTRRKAAQIAAEEGAEVVGAIIRTAHGRVALVQGGAVRWLTEGALWELMHPGPDVRMDELPKLPAVPDESDGAAYARMSAKAVNPDAVRAVMLGIADVIEREKP